MQYTPGQEGSDSQTRTCPATSDHGDQLGDVGSGEQESSVHLQLGTNFLSPLELVLLEMPRPQPQQVLVTQKQAPCSALVPCRD